MPPENITKVKTIAKTDDGFSIVEVKEDPSHTFLVLRSFLDNDFYVREDYEIPVSGNITIANWNNNSITDTTFLVTLTDILENVKPDLQYSIDVPYAPNLSDEYKLRELYVGYNDCPVATSNLGYLGTINGVWYITADISETSVGDYQVSCARIPQAYHAVLEKWD